MFKIAGSSRKRRDGSEKQFNATFFPSVSQPGVVSSNLRKLNGSNI